MKLKMHRDWQSYKKQNYRILFSASSSLSHHRNVKNEQIMIKFQIQYFGLQQSRKVCVGDIM